MSNEKYSVDNPYRGQDDGGGYVAPVHNSYIPAPKQDDGMCPTSKTIQELLGILILEVNILFTIGWVLGFIMVVEGMVK